MRKFDETALENQNWKDIAIQGELLPLFKSGSFVLHRR